MKTTLTVEPVPSVYFVQECTMLISACVVDEFGMAPYWLSPIFLSIAGFKCSSTTNSSANSVITRAVRLSPFTTKGVCKHAVLDNFMCQHTKYGWARIMSCHFVWRFLYVLHGTKTYPACDIHVSLSNGASRFSYGNEVEAVKVFPSVNRRSMRCGFYDTKTFRNSVKQRLSLFPVVTARHAFKQLE